MTININELTLGQIKEIANLTGSGTQPTPFKVGKAYLIRTVTMAHTGRVSAIIGGFLVLDDAAWIADTGRFNEAISKGTLNEIEPIEGPLIVSLGSIVDASEWNHVLPKGVK